MACRCLLLFYPKLTELVVSTMLPSFVALNLPVSDNLLLKMYYLRAFVVVLHYIVNYNIYFGVFIEKHVYTKFRLDWLLC